MAKSLRTEPAITKKPDLPKCPMHGTPMVFVVEQNAFKCQRRGCAQFAWPQQDVSKGRPILGHGQVEVLLIDDPDGYRGGRTMLRTTENNVIIDITEYVQSMAEDRNGNTVLRLKVTHTADNRTRRTRNE